MILLLIDLYQESLKSRQGAPHYLDVNSLITFPSDMNYTKYDRGVYNRFFFENVAPIKITESRKLKQNAVSWGIVTHYYVESIKINCSKEGVTSTVATLKIGDVSGQIVCLVRGSAVGALFDLSADEWLEVEKLCNHGQQLFYRYFKDGLKSSFNYEQKIFYNFCATSQKNNVLVAAFRRGVNQRNKDKNDPFLEILELSKCDEYVLDLYLIHLRNSMS